MIERVKSKLLAMRLAVLRLAVLNRRRDRRTVAESLFRRALVIFETALGDDHPHSRQTRRNLRLLLEEEA